MVDRLRFHAANDGKFVSVLSHLWQVFANLDAIDICLDRSEWSGGRPPRLHIESIDLASSPFHVKHYAAFSGLLGLGGNCLRVEQRTPICYDHTTSGDKCTLKQTAPAEVLLSVAVYGFKVYSHIILTIYLDYRYIPCHVSSG